MKPIFLTVIALLLGQPALADTPRFAKDPETVADLRKLYDQSDDICRGPMAQTVTSAAACVSRAIYGDALNYKGWCYGQTDQANAQMRWHPCTKTSLRFQRVVVPGILD